MSICLKPRGKGGEWQELKIKKILRIWIISISDYAMELAFSPYRSGKTLKDLKSENNKMRPTT